MVDAERRRTEIPRAEASRPVPDWLIPQIVVRAVRDVRVVGYTVLEGTRFVVEAVWANPPRALLRPVIRGGELVCLLARDLEEDVADA